MTNQSGQFGDNIDDLPVDSQTPPSIDSTLLVNLFAPVEQSDTAQNLKVLAVSGVMFLVLNMFMRKHIHKWTKNETYTTGAIIGAIVATSFVLKRYVFV